MKMAVFDFALRKKGVYGVLHIIILCFYPKFRIRNVIQTPALS